jgi:hypothetical protein
LVSDEFKDLLLEFKVYFMLLHEKAALFVVYTRKMGLSMNATKTKLLFSSLAGNVTNTTVEVDGSIIHPGNVIELLGVKYDRRPSTGPISRLCSPP